MKEYIKKFNTLETVEGYKMDNPFITVVVSTGQNLACVDGEYMTVEDNLAVLVHMVPKPANNEFYYRTVLNEPVYPNENTLLGKDDTILNIVSNTYDDSFKGYRMVLDGDLVKVGDNAFYKTCGFTYIRFPDSLERICYRSFRQCSDQWMYIHFGSGIKYIEDQAFHADQIKNLVFPSSLISVGDAFWYSGINNEDGILRLPAGISYGHLFANAWAFDTLIFEEGITEIGPLFNGAQSSDVKHVILPTTLRIIGNNVFSSNPLLKEITLPTGLQSIGDWAFWRTGLTSIEIPNSVTSIGNCAFHSCSGLTSVTIGNKVTSIGVAAFQDCTSLTSVTIPNIVNSIGKDAFYNCSGLTSIEIPNSVTNIGEYAFCNCSGLTVVDIPNSVTSIGSSTFYKCLNLTSFHIPASVTSIGDAVVSAGTSLRSITVDPNNKYYDSRNNCNAIIETATNKLISGHLNVTNIPDTVTSIGFGAFSMDGCETTASTLDLPASITSIGDYAFEESPSLITIYCSATTPPTLGGEHVFSGCTNIAHIYVPADSVDAYKAAANWSTFASIIEAIPSAE